jgi:hypothetical protein
MKNPKENLRVVKDNYTGVYKLEEKKRKFLSKDFQWKIFKKPYELSFRTFEQAEKHIEDKYEIWLYTSGLKERYTPIEKEK